MATRRVRLVGLVVALIAALIVGLVTGLGAGWLLGRSQSESVGDHRAYLVDSGGITLEEGLRRATIVLPDCVEDEDLRYAWINEGYGYHQDGYLMLRTYEACMNAFISDNYMVARVTRDTQLAGPEAASPAVYPEFWKDEVFEELGWEIGPEQEFEQFGTTTLSKYRLTALVRHLPGSSEVRAYIYTYRVG